MKLLLAPGRLQLNRQMLALTPETDRKVPGHSSPPPLMQNFKNKEARGQGGLHPAHRTGAPVRSKFIHYRRASWTQQFKKAQSKSLFEGVYELCQIRISKTTRNYKTLDVDNISGANCFKLFSEESYT